MIKAVFECYGREVPQDYLCISFVTTGLNFGYSIRDVPGAEPPGNDVIVELGQCDVTDGHAEKHVSSILNWTRLPELIEPLWLENTLAGVTEQMAESGRRYPVSYDLVRQSQCHPIEGLRRYVGLLEDAIDADKVIVGHNLLGFGVPVLADATEEWVGARFEIPLESVLDLGVLEKARQIGEYPMAGEAMSDYLKRVHDMRVGGVRWGLEYCCRTYGLYAKHDLESHGGAGYTARLCHLLLEEMREAPAE